MFISLAYAQSAPVATSNGVDVLGFLPMVGIFVLFYFLLIRPQQKKAKEHKGMLNALQVGDEVVSAGGLMGKVNKLSDTVITLEVAPNVEVSIQRQAIQLVLPKGTLG